MPLAIITAPAGSSVIVPRKWKTVIVNNVMHQVNSLSPKQPRVENTEEQTMYIIPENQEKPSFLQFYLPKIQCHNIIKTLRLKVYRSLHSLFTVKQSIHLIMTVVSIKEHV